MRWTFSNSQTRCLSVLDFWNVNLGVYYKLEKKSISNQTWFFFEFELDFYYLCSLQKSISKSNWFFNFLNSIFRNWKKIEWHSIFQKSSGDRQGDCLWAKKTQADGRGSEFTICSILEVCVWYLAQKRLSVPLSICTWNLSFSRSILFQNWKKNQVVMNLIFYLSLN